MSFQDHLEDHRNEDGSYDLAGAEEARAEELAGDPDAIESLAGKAAATERRRWESNNSARLRKQFGQPALSGELELDVMVQLGDNTVVRLGEMHRERIQIRKDLRTRTHLDESRAYDTEMTHWFQTEQLLDGDATIEESLR